MKLGPTRLKTPRLRWRCTQALWPKLEAEPSLKKVFSDIELPLVPVLSRIERCGALLDEDRLWTEQSRELGHRCRHSKKRPTMSPAQVQPGLTQAAREILFEKLELPVLKKTPKGRRPPLKKYCRSWRWTTSCQNS
jgi:DNA polymerase-1